MCRDVNKKGFVDPVRTLTLAQLKQDQADRSRTPTGKDVNLHRLFLDPHNKTHLANTQVQYSTIIIFPRVLFVISNSIAKFSKSPKIYLITALK